MNRPIRVVIDTNIWISFLIGKRLAGLQKHLMSQQVVILFSQELFDEFMEVVSRPKFRRYFASEDVRELVALLDLTIMLVNVQEHFSICRDAKDNFLLDLCMAGDADYLVTGNPDLLELRSFKRTTIVTYRSVEAIMAGITP